MNSFSQDTYNKIFGVGILTIFIALAYLIMRAPPSINDVLKNTNFYNKEECDAFVKGLVRSVSPCANTARNQLCTMCNSGNVPDALKPVCAHPSMVGACTGV